MLPCLAAGKYGCKKDGALFMSTTGKKPRYLLYFLTILTYITALYLFLQ